MTIERTHFSEPTLALGGQGTAGDYFALLKPRVMSLVIFTAIVGLFAAPGYIHPWLGFITILCIALGAGASGALNMWYDADIDAVMKRTQQRPIPSGAIQPGEALGFGLTLAVASVIMFGLFVNWQAAALLAFTIFFYVVIYSMVLKRWTAQNIVIGGAAGAFPPMISWVAVTHQVDLGSISLFLLIFMWTPPHFWALALFREGDYEKAGVPMLPNVVGRPETRKQILIYSLLLVPTVALPCFTGTAGLLYAVGAGLLTSLFLKHAFDVYRLADGPAGDKACKKLFGFSIFWLFAVFALILIERIAQLPAFGNIFQ
ncbi:MAG: heme o synthase [Alphaproteobacteria bacterium]|nr:heme o synthase [Alphaproteobacteria bacterium]